MVERQIETPKRRNSRGRRGDPGKGKGKGKQKSKGEENVTTDTWTTPLLPTPPPLPPALPAAADGSEDARLAKAIREAAQQSGISLPTAIQELINKADDGDGKSVTKSLHFHTSALGNARKQVRQIRQARATQAKAWAQYIQATLDTLEKGALAHAERMGQLQSQEQKAMEKGQLAQKAIQQLSNDQVVDLEDEPEDDELVVDDNEAINQVSKRLKMTLNELRDALPASASPAAAAAAAVTTTTKESPRARKLPAGADEAMAIADDAQPGGGSASALPPPN